MQSCFHCDTDCEVEVFLNEKIFCCEGCKTVYEIISESDLSTYYNLNAHPGVKAKNGRKHNYDYLDLPEIEEKLVLFNEGFESRISFLLPQIHCSSCLWLLENISKLNDAIYSCQVNFVEKRADILYDKSRLSTKELAELLDRIGYSPDIDLEQKETTKPKKDKKLLYSIGIVGFCFGNIMLLSFPEYLGIDESYSQFQSTFNWLNLALSVPILIFGARYYIVSAFKSIAAKHVNIDVPITLGIFALYFRSIFEITFNVGAGYFDSFAGLIFFLLIGKWFQQKTYAAINFERNYKSYFPISVTKIEDAGESIIALDKIYVGDKLLVRNGELIPADSILLEGNAMIDYSFVSGESILVSKNSGDKLYAGGRQQGASVLLQTVKNVDSSYLTRLWNNPVFHSSKTKESLSDIVSKYFTLIILLISLIASFVWYQIDSSKVAFVVTSVLIVACPCAIALAVPFTYGNAIRSLGKSSVFLRSSDVIEPLNNVSDIVFDKTGTLTLNDRVGVKWNGKHLSNTKKTIIYQLVSQSTHPLSLKIKGHLEKFENSTTLVLKDFEETTNKGVSGTVNDNFWFIGKHKNSKSINSSKSIVAVYAGDEELGYYEISNSYRPGIENVLKRLNTVYTIHLLSGDNDSEKSYLSQYFKNDHLNFQQSPQDKLDYINELQNSGKKVLMLGDGLNDAGALKQADIGLAIVDDIHAFSPSSDIIMDGEQLTNLDRIIDFATYSKKVILASYVFSVLYNLTGLFFALTGQLTPLIAAILMPLSSISTVLLVTILIKFRANRLL